MERDEECLARNVVTALCLDKLLPRAWKGHGEGLFRQLQGQDGQDMYIDKLVIESSSCL